MSSQTDGSAEGCPVDHKTRQAWLDKARAANATTPSKSSGSASATPNTYFSLDQSRVVSSIPRATSSLVSPHDLPKVSTTAPATGPPPSANAETTAPATSTSGNWIYPSEQMFFDAMRRKSYSPDASDMSSIVPIHNAVNERAWAEIKAWERPYTNPPSSSSSSSATTKPCADGPRLVSFSGESKALTPRARWNMLWGYTRPFDRHDWVVDRCGTRVDYVIDFYEGKGRGKGDGLSFYLDVRPKLNGWEGVRMRTWKALGLV